MTRRCPRCAATLPDSAQYCTICGQPMTPAAPAAPPTVGSTARTGSACPNCGNPLKGTERFCKRCGAPLSAPAAAPAPTGGVICSNCGNASNPPGSNYCVRCGNSLVNEAPAERAEPPPRVTSFAPSQGLVCPNCGKPVRSGTRFCVACGAEVVPPTPAEPAPSENEEAAPPPEDKDSTEASAPSEPGAQGSTALTSEGREEAESIAVPDDVLTNLVARGQQLALEDEAGKTKSLSDDLIENLSEAATSEPIPLEELIDTYVNERTEQERLEGLHESGEASDRVYDRLTKEYDNKLTDMDEKIQEGVTTFRGYQAYLRQELAKTEEELETLEAKKEVGDEGDIEEGQATLAKQAQRLRSAMNAVTHILDKEAALHGEPASRFEVSETTVGTTSAEEAPEPVVVKPSTARKPKPTPDVEAGKICPACGHVTPSNTKFCTYCGKRV